MMDHDYSQLPVVDAGNFLLGMITYESIMRAMRSFNVKVDGIAVRDAMIKPPQHLQDDDLFDLLDDLQRTNAVIIIDLDSHPIAIVTSYDTTEYLRERTEDTMRLEEIELTIKDLIKLAYKNAEGGLDEQGLSEAVDSLYVARDQPGSGRAKTFEDLTLNDYIILLTEKRAWENLTPVLQIKREALIELLQKVRRIRNDIAHFRSQISPRDRDDLRYCAEWLTKRYQEYQSLHRAGSISAKASSAGDAVKPEPRQSAAKSEPLPAVQVFYMPRKRRFIDLRPVPENPTPKSRRGKSRYSALAEWLSNQTENTIVLTFQQVEEIIGYSLPDSARAFRAWWANDQVSHTQSVAWLGAGWRVEAVDLGQEWVRFARQSGTG
jgi:hypothetical protein